MSLAKIPFIFLFGLGTHFTFNPPNPAAPKNERKMEDGPLEVHLATFIARVGQTIVSLDKGTSHLSLERLLGTRSYRVGDYSGSSSPKIDCGRYHPDLPAAR